MTRDSMAATQGGRTPPHIDLLSYVYALRDPFSVCDDLSKISRRAVSHLQKQIKFSSQRKTMNTNIFIGHGRSDIWRELKDFINDRLKIPWDEFNRIPTAGITNISRISQMLDNAAFAFLVMTAEDE